jgi:nitric oxide reductase NorQ protein
VRTITPDIEELRVTEPPFYMPVGDEVELFTHAASADLPVILKGPTGCGKSRFVAYMAHKLGRPLVLGDETVWADGPLTAGVRHGAIVYLDEVVEARNDTLVVIHPLTDDRRILPIERLGQVLHAPEDFTLVVSYNPGYQSVLKEMKQSTRQRFISLDFSYPPPEVEAQVVAAESGVGAERAELLVRAAVKIRNLTDRGLEEGVSTRLLVYAGKLMARGVAPQRACEVAFVRTLTDDADLQRSVAEVVRDFF